MRKLFICYFFVLRSCCPNTFAVLSCLLVHIFEAAGHPPWAGSSLPESVKHVTSYGQMQGFDLGLCDSGTHIPTHLHCAVCCIVAELCCFAGQVLGASMVKHDLLHHEARVRACKCYWQAQCHMPDAVAAFEKEWNAPHPEHRLLDVRHFIKLSVESLESRFHLFDEGGQGRPHKLSHEDAELCAQMLVDGYPQECVVTVGSETRRFVEQKQFTSLGQALQMSAPLRALTIDKGMSEDYVMGRLHDVRPYLAYGVMPVKLQLSQEAMNARVKYCTEMLEKLEREPGYLERIFWADECRIWVNKELSGKLKVWYDKRQLEGQPPQSSPMSAIHGSKRIDFFLIVNAELGCVHVEFLTGTTDIDSMGRLTPGMREHIERRKQYDTHFTGKDQKPGTGCYRVSQI